MYVKHFKSEPSETQTDPGGKFLEALENLNDYCLSADSLIYRSNAIDEFLDLYKRQHYPGLGSVKKLSMQHHVELIANKVLI